MVLFLPTLAVLTLLHHQDHLRHENHPKKHYTPKEALRVFFDIKDKDLNEKCDKVGHDQEARWKKIRESLSDLKDAIAAKRDDRKSWEKLNDDDKYKEAKNVIKTALPCAKKAKVNEKLEFYKKPKVIKVDKKSQEN